MLDFAADLASPQVLKALREAEPLEDVVIIVFRRTDGGAVTRCDEHPTVYW